MDKARMTAAIVLNEIMEQGAYANVALTKELSRTELSRLDRRLVTELVYGATKAWGSVDYVLGCYLNRPLSKIPPMIRAVLRMGIYQLFWLDKIPPSAAVNTAVDLAKKYAHPGTVKFVNAVLRSASRAPEKAAFPEADRALHLSLAKEHPLWLVKHWLREFGEAETIRLLDFDNEPPYLSLRANTLKISREGLVKKLQSLGLKTEISPWAPEGVICGGDLPLSAITPLSDGLCQAQDISSMLAAHVLGARPGETVIDACSAPGGKATHLAALMENRGKVIASDIYDHKLARVRENARRLGIGIIETKLVEAQQLGKKYPAAADRLLLDVPCSGLGVLRRRADARWRKTADTSKELLPLQREIMLGAADALKPGGVMVYSTCTMEESENAAMVESFLQARPDFSLSPAGKFLPCAKRDETMIRLYPQRDGIDGFFIARLEKS